jgi:hypothetical protein
VSSLVFRLLALGGTVILLAGCLRKEEMKMTYGRRCLGCHGTFGKGDGPIAASLPVPVPDFQDTVKRKSVFEIRSVIKKGKGVMPAFEPALRKYEIQDMVRFVRILSMEGRSVEWWEKFEPLIWAHCSVPWEYVYGYDGAGGGNKP